VILISISIACMTNITCGSVAGVSRFENRGENIVNLSNSNGNGSDVIISFKTS